MVSQFFRFLRKYSPFTRIVTKTIPISFSERLKGKNTIVFGATGGIGEAISRSIVNSGGSVVISGTNKDKLLSLSKELDNAPYLVVDLNNISEIKDTISHFLSEDGKPIDNMVYAAGIHGPSDYFAISENDYDAVMGLNLRGMFFSCQIISDYMIKKKINGHILLIGSASAMKPAFSPYELSKWGVRAFTLGLARELVEYGITVNSIAPGPVKTKMLIDNKVDELNWVANPTGRLCTPEEIGELAVFMLSESGDYIIGDTVFMSGGSGNIDISK